MRQLTLSKGEVSKRLSQIISEVEKGEIVEGDSSSLFSLQHNLSAELLVYVLLRASKEFSFEINEDFVNSLGDYSFHSIVNTIEKVVNR